MELLESDAVETNLEPRRVEQRRGDVDADQGQLSGTQVSASSRTSS
jgi:hypothetical protein